MSEFNDWGDDLDESFGDVLEEKLEQEAKDAAKEEAKRAGKAGLKAADKLTDKISPVKAVKNKIKDVMTNNPLAHAKRTVQSTKKKLKEKAKKFAKDGVKAIGKAIAHAMKSIGAWIAAHPIPSLIILIVLILIFKYVDIETDDTGSGSEADSSVMTDYSLPEDSDGMSDDDIVVTLMEDCGDSSGGSGGSEITDVNEDKEQIIKHIYSVFHSYGLTNASIAGILGNMETEGGIDPTGIEGIYDEDYHIGTEKSKALASMSDYTEHTLFPKYEGRVPINKNGYKADDGKYYCGMGLIQWTGGGAKTFLSAAQTVNQDWYTLEFQLAYMLSDTLYRKNFFSGWVANQETGNDVATAKKAAVKFAHEYEGNSWNDSVREGHAETYFNFISSWSDSDVDQTFVDSITDMAVQLGGLIEFDSIATKNERCGNTAGKVDNSNLASAAVSYAYPTKAESYNNGTNLYQTVIQGVYNGDTYYKACDRVVGGAVRWSGTDDDYPLTTSVQLAHLSSSPKWELVGTADTLTEEDLQPGDVFILDGHTLIYVGEEAVKKVHGDKAEAGSNSVSGSLDDRAASCNADVTNIFANGGGDHRGKYQVYRCINPDKSSTYSNVGAGMGS